MRKLILFLTAVGVISLTGCNPEEMYGVSGDRWAAMTTEQHQVIEEGYGEVHAAMAEEEANTKIKSNAKTIRVAVYGGRTLMAPFDYYQAYERSVVDLTEGACDTAELYQQNGDKEIDVTLCYRNHELEVDPSRFVFSKRHGTVAFHESPLWKAGMTYKHVKSSGYARLKNAHIYVKQLT